MKLIFMVSLLSIALAQTGISAAPVLSTDETLIVLVGDSTVCDALGSWDQAGWGWALEASTNAGYKVINTAKGGRSSRSFRTEGRWDEALAYHPDWILIQFGHNDQKGKGPERESDPETDYRDHLRRYIQEAREQEAQPVLITPVCRRTFSENGDLLDRLESYAEAVRIVGAEMNVPVLDLHARSSEVFSHMGAAACDRLGPPSRPQDHTHFSKEGSRVVAQMVYDLMHMSVPVLADGFKSPLATSSEPMAKLVIPGEKQDGVHVISGPFFDSLGGISEKDTLEFNQEFSSIINADQGSLSCWLYLDRSYQSGPEVEEWKEVVASIPGVLDLSIASSKNTFSIYSNWRGGYRYGGYMRAQLPKVSGPGWHHIAFVWDTTMGIQNLFFDGAPALADLPTYTPGASGPEVHQLAGFIYPHIGLSDVRFYDRKLSSEEIQTVMSVWYRHQSDALLGASKLGELGLDRTALRLFYEDTLLNTGRSTDWILEGPGLLDYTDEGLEMKSATPDAKMGHFVYWLDKKIPSDFVAEWNVRILSEYGLNIVFFNATGPDGISIFDPSVEARDGDFKQYHSSDIDCYHISYYADGEEHPGRSTSNLRKNSGFYLVSNGPAGIPAESSDWHQVTLVKQNGRIQLAVDGDLAIDWVDDGQAYGPILGDGWFGLRQMVWSDALYKNLKIYTFND